MYEVLKIDYPNTPAGKKQWMKQFGANAYYAGKFWAQRKKDADYWHAMVRACMDRQGLRKRPFDRPVTVTFWWNDRLDLDNHSIMGKYIMDAMKGRLLQDDSRRWVKEITHRWHDGNCIKVEIREVQHETTEHEGNAKHPAGAGHDPGRGGRSGCGKGGNADRRDRDH